jgi:hypothetical protein
VCLASGAAGHEDATRGSDLRRMAAQTGANPRTVGNVIRAQRKNVTAARLLRFGIGLRMSLRRQEHYRADGNQGANSDFMK